MTNSENRWMAVWETSKGKRYPVCPNSFLTVQEAISHGWTHKDEILEQLGNGHMLALSPLDPTVGGCIRG